MDKLIQLYNDKIYSFLEYRSDIIDNEFALLFGDSFKFLQVLNQGKKALTMYKFQTFLKGLDIDSAGIEEQINKLYEYTSTKERAEFVANSIDKVLVSNSKKSAFLLGLFFSDIIENSIEPTYKDIVFASEITNFYDFDIDNLLLAVEYLKFNKDKNVFFPSSSGLRKWCESNQINCDESIKLTFDKASSNQFIILYSDSNVDMSQKPNQALVSTSRKYKFSEVGNLFVKYSNYIEMLK